MPLNDSLTRRFRKIVGRPNVDTGTAELLTFASDGLTLHQAAPECVVYPQSTGEVAAIVKACNRAGVSFVARGAGTGLSGGAIIDGGVIIQLSRMNQIIDLSADNRFAIVQPGVVNSYLSLQTRPYGLEFAPDPSSQAACTIGGNVAENAGGPHTLKQGVTLNHVLGQTVVMADGQVATFGGPYLAQTGPSFSSFLVGSEGTLGITTEVTVRLVPVAPGVTTMLATFADPAGATDSVTAILAARILPSALEFIDQLCIQAVEAHLKVGFPTDAGAILLIELDSDDERSKGQAETIEALCREHGAIDFKLAQSEEERQKLWLGRKHVAGAMGKISPAYYTNDGVVPRSRLTDILQAVYRIAGTHKLKVANIAHAGDGNIHPLILFDPDTPDGPDRALACSEDILAACLEMGGSLSGEHGIGLEKREMMARMYSGADLAHMRRLRDGLSPLGLLNPGKLLPEGARCGEVKNGATLPEGTWL